MDRAVIESYARGAGLVASALEGLSADELTSHPIENTWSIQQIVLHLMDADLIASDRMKRIIAEDNPLLIGYNETRFSERLHYHDADPRAAAEVFRLNREMTAALLRTLPDADFDRTGIHSERGKVSLGQLVRAYDDHLHHHLRFLHAKRRALGKPLASAPAE